MPTGLGFFYLALRWTDAETYTTLLGPQDAEALCCKQRARLPSGEDSPRKDPFGLLDFAPVGKAGNPVPEILLGHTLG